MHELTTKNGHPQIIIPIRVQPHIHKAVPTVTGSMFSGESGTVLYGHYNMEYLLPSGDGIHFDRLRLIANHDKKTVQLILCTHNPELLKSLPGERQSSLVADIISKINRYCIKSESYSKPLNPAQQKKLKLANEAISSLKKLLALERLIKPNDHIGQEILREELFTIIEECRDSNRLIANHLLVSEGTLGDILYDAHKTTQHYEFNRVYAVSSHDQMDFTETKPQNEQQSPPCFIWDSELHIGHNNEDLDDALRVICKHYQLIPAKTLKNVPANRFEKVEAFIQKLWLEGKEWVDYLSLPTQPIHKTEIKYRKDGLSITQISPYYSFQGISQKSDPKVEEKGYSDLKNLAFSITNNSIQPINAKNKKEAIKALRKLSNGNWAIVGDNQHIVLRQNDQFLIIKYFINQNLIYPLPEGQDLYDLSQVSKRHLYLPERVSLKLKAFLSRIPSFFTNFFNSMVHFIVNDLYNEFFDHVHERHIKKNTKEFVKDQLKTEEKNKSSLHEALENKGLLPNNQSLEDFIKEHISNSPYIIARANHPPSPTRYTNPFHRTFGVIRHIAGFFVDTSERNPMIGTLAMAAYVYGAGAVLAPNALAALLTKLHLSGLIYGIEPTQKLAHFMSHGALSEAISASATYWQGAVVGGNLDKFFVNAVTILKDDPSEVAIIAALALSLGYGLTKAIPPLQKEMGEFPYTTYAALGGKGGAAIYDTIMHPGDDWLLGTCKWLFKNGISLCKLFFAPFFEWAFYGFYNGFISGWKKSWNLTIRLGKQIISACADLFLGLCTIPLLEISALLIHVPFRGVTNFLSKLLGTLGDISSIGIKLVDFALSSGTYNFVAHFRVSPLYGFSSPIIPSTEEDKNQNSLLNLKLVVNILRTIFLPLFQIIKNIMILPLMDLTALTCRIALTISMPIVQISALFIGGLTYIIGASWDNTMGIMFSGISKGVIHLSNWIDRKTGTAKQFMVSVIEASRSELYDWAFNEEDALSHKTLKDCDYFTSDPMRITKIPTESHCLLNTLLNDKNVTVSLDSENPKSFNSPIITKMLPPSNQTEELTPLLNH